MKKRELIYPVIFLLIIIVLYSEGTMKFLKQSYESFSMNVIETNITDEINNTKDHKEQAEGGEKDTTATGAEETTEGFKDTLVRRERLTQSYIDHIPRIEGQKIAYLTFDDGPTPGITTDILDILKEEEVLATFFVVGQNVERYPHILERIHEEGHVVGNHTYSHNYGRIYRSPSLYMEDLIKGEETIRAVLGQDYELTLTRFPGGSFGGYKGAFRRRVNEEGYVYIDWNSLNGDSEGINLSADYLINRFKNTSRGKDVLVILMHDAFGKAKTVETLPYIINQLKREGYELRALPQYIETEIINDHKIESFTH